MILNQSANVIKKNGGRALAIIGLIAILYLGWQLFNNFRNPPITPYSGYSKDSSVGLRVSGESLGLAEPPSFTERQGVAPSPFESGGVDAGIEDRKVVKTGALDILVEDVEESAEAIELIAGDFEGIVSNVRVYEVRDGVKSGQVTIHVPADNFDKALEAIKLAAVKVDSEVVNARDVTEEFVDLEARLKNMRAEEAQYLQIMTTAKTVEDTLRVSERLYRVRGQIEQLQGRIKYLERQVSMSSINVSLTEEEDVEVFGLRWRPLVVAKQSLRNMLDGLAKYADAVIRFVIYLPVLIVWLFTILLAGFIAWRLLRWLKRRFIGGDEAGSTPRKSPDKNSDFT